MSAAEDILAIRAGAGALARLRTHGLDPAEVSVIPAAAGGPKGLTLIGLDKAIFGEWLPRAPRERWLIGASIGAWRMAAACRPDPLGGLDRLIDLYCFEQDYSARPSAADVSKVCRSLVERLVDGEAAAILAHPQHRLALLTVRGRGVLARGAGIPGWGLAAAANALGRRHLAHFLDRGVFTDRRNGLPFFGQRFDAFDNHVTTLTKDNLQAALLASASIPLVLEGVNRIAGAPRGIYWDGGIIDYQLALPYPTAPGLVLYPHYIESITPGWLDKPFHRRRASAAALDNVIMIGPSRDFVARLPGGKLPDRSDFKRYGANPGKRAQVWRQVAAECERLGEVFLRWCEKPDVAMVRSFDAS
jgi:hypothetical protein